MQQFSSLLSWRLFTAQHVSGVFPPIIRSSVTAVAASGFTFVSWWQSCCFRGRAGRPAGRPTGPTTNTTQLSPRSGRPARPRTQHNCHHDTKVKPKAATAVTELPMMGGRMPETCWAVNKRQDNKLENCCIWLVIYLNWNEFRIVRKLQNNNHWWHHRGYLVGLERVFGCLKIS